MQYDSNNLVKFSTINSALYSSKYQFCRPYAFLFVREPVPLIQVFGPDTACDGLVGLTVRPEDGGDFAPIIVVQVDTIQVLDRSQNRVSLLSFLTVLPYFYCTVLTVGGNIRYF